MIADIGSNHNGSLSLAKRLIDRAAMANIDAVKIQIYTAEGLYSRYVPRHSQHKKNLWETIKEIQTPLGWIPKLKSYCKKKKILFFATPFDIAAVDQLENYVSFYKIASFELTDLSLVEAVAKKNKPIIISTGLATLKEINEAYRICLRQGNRNIMFLHCVSAYPSKPKDMNLKAMQTLAETFNVPVGLSDHSHGIHISLAAVAMGAKIIEKHLTLDRNMKGPDHPFAMEPCEFADLISQIRDIEYAFGDGKKRGPSTSERENFRIGRRSIHARSDISKGTIIKKDMLIIKRPSLGIKPEMITALAGRVARRNIKADKWITWKDVR